MYSSAIELVAHELVQSFARAHNVTVISSDRYAVTVEMRVLLHALYAQGVRSNSDCGWDASSCQLQVTGICTHKNYFDAQRPPGIMQQANVLQLIWLICKSHKFHLSSARRARVAQRRMAEASSCSINPIHLRQGSIPLPHNLMATIVLCSQIVSLERIVTAQAHCGHSIHWELRST